MNSETIVLIEIVFGAAVAFGFGFYQLWSVNRDMERDKAGAKKGSATGTRPGPGHAEGEHELDDR